MSNGEEQNVEAGCTQDHNTSTQSLKESDESGDGTGVNDTPSSSLTLNTFWRDQKFWIQIAIFGTMQLAISGYMAFLSQTRMEVPPSFWQKVEALETSCAYCTCVAGKLFEKDVLDIDCKNVDCDLKKLINKDWETRKKILEQYLDSKIEELEKKLNGVEGQIDLSFSLIDSINHIIVCVLLSVLIGGIFVAYKFLISRKAPNEKTGRPSDTPRNDAFDTIIEKLKRKGLKKGLLVVSFLPSTQQFHLDALNAVPEFQKASPVKVLVQSFDDVMDVEPHKLVIIFVDFNTRNIILENADTESGDLRNQTTKVFKFLGCDVFVVYCKDKESTNLQPDNLYNPRLLSVELYPVLSALKNKKRVLSIDDKFHPHQVEHLKSCCQQL